VSADGTRSDATEGTLPVATSIYDPPAKPAGRRWPASARLVPLAAQLLIWSGAAAVLALWWHDTTVVAGTADWLSGAAHITGLLAGYGCAVLLALMARLPLLDRNVGTDRLSRWHAMGGRYVISLTIAHVVLAVWGYALASGTGVVDQAMTMLRSYPDMLTATAGFLLLLATAVLSARAARRRMRYETWYYLHLMTYLAIYLGFWHQLSLGDDFVAHPATRASWYVLYLTVAVLLVWYRFVVPLRRGLRHRLRVARVHAEAPGVVSVYLTGRRLDELNVAPGQFLRWRFLARGLWWTATPYSLSAPASDGWLRITVKAVGGHSRAVTRLTPGTRVWAEGPYGGLTAARRSSGKTLLLAGGVGITPLRALFETLPGDVSLIYRARHPEDLALRGELDAIAAARGAEVHYLLGRRSDRRSDPLTAPWLRRLVPDLAERDVYLCGPPGMTETAIRSLRRAGVPRRRIHHESFAF
jgi:predicted ferric reductase